MEADGGCHRSRCHVVRSTERGDELVERILVGQIDDDSRLGPGDLGYAVVNISANSKIEGPVVGKTARLTFIPYPDKGLYRLLQSNDLSALTAQEEARSRVRERHRERRVC